MTAISQQPLARIDTELRAAIDAKKCWRCGCFQNAVKTFQRPGPLRNALDPLLEEAARRFEEQRYDCLGCEVCWPAVAQTLAADIDPAVGEGTHCATEALEPREGWPPLPGDYQIIRFRAPVAVCTLNSDHLTHELGAAGLEGLAIVGSLHTENLGIERLIRNTLANPHIRFLVLCGEDTRKAIGHLPGQSLSALIQYGVDDRMRIVGAEGKRPLLKNLVPEHVEAFRSQVQVIAQIGNTNVGALKSLIATTASNDPGAFCGAPADTASVPIEAAESVGRLVLDPAGYFVVYPDRVRGTIMLEHYSNRGVLDRVFSGTSAPMLYTGAIDAGLVSRLDHAAYLGRELTRAEWALQNGERYVQDRAPADSDPPATTQNESHVGGCGCPPNEGGSCC
jgi:tetrahydromethanopterin S-methyltransferase subunit A